MVFFGHIILVSMSHMQNQPFLRVFNPTFLSYDGLRVQNMANSSKIYRFRHISERNMPYFTLKILHGTKETYPSYLK